MYTAGHTAADGDGLTRPDLARRGIDLARMMRLLLPDSAEAAGLLAVLLLTEARQAARVDDAGQLVLMEDQDRSLWDHSLIAEGLGSVREALAGERPVGRFAVMAAIAAVHADPVLATYPDLASTRAELLRRTGRVTEARAAYEEALAFTSNAVEAEFLQGRINRGA